MHPSSPIVPSLREGLLAEHAWIQGLLDDTIAAVNHDDPAAAKTAWRAFTASLLAHLDGEDRLISYLPPEHERSARLLAHEHRYIRLQLAELGHAAGAGEFRRDRLIDLRDILRAHAKSDERLLYRWADENLDDDRRLALLAALRGRRDMTPAGSPPATESR